MTRIAFIPLSNDFAYHRDVAVRATAAGCSQVQLSHNICHNADDLLDDPAKALRAREITQLHRQAGQEVWCWTHEFRNPPAEFIEDRLLDLDQPGLWTFLEAKYTRFFEEVLPDLDGLILTFAETHFPVYQDRRVKSRESRQMRTARLIRTLYTVCRRHGKRLAVRDFVYRLDEVERMTETIRDVERDVPVMSKCVPHDWEPFYPHNPTIGAYGLREQWVEYDLGHEYEGQHLYPFAEVERNLERLRYGYARGVRTVALRLDRPMVLGRQSALYTPWGELELLVFSRFSQDPAVEAEDIWRRWAADKFPGARELVETATTCVYKFMFALRFWMANHSNLPTVEYAETHINDGNADRLPVWTGKAEDWEADRNFRAMPRFWLDTCLQEADEAERLAQRCAEIASRTDCADGWRDVWLRGVRNLELWCGLFCAYKRVYFPLQYLARNPGTMPKADVERALNQLETLCQDAAPEIRAQHLEWRVTAEAFPEVLASLRARLAAL